MSEGRREMLERVRKLNHAQIEESLKDGTLTPSDLFDVSIAALQSANSPPSVSARRKERSGRFWEDSDRLDRKLESLLGE